MRIAQQSLHSPAHVAGAHKLGGTERDGDGNERDVVLPLGERVVVVLGLLHRGHGRRIRAHSLALLSYAHNLEGAERVTRASL